MAQKKLQPNIYTQLNTDPLKYLIQNRSNNELHLISSATQPLPNAKVDITLGLEMVITQNEVEGIFWGKPSGNRVAIVGIL